MNLLIFGPPGSGKGTYSQRLVPMLGVIKISTGDFFRDAIKQDNELGKRASGYMSKGELVPDEIVNPILKDIISRPEAGNGFILDGFPRTLLQAKFLDKITKIDAIINIIAPEEILVEKISARRVCSNPKCDGNFNIADIKKKINGIDYVLPPLLPKNDMKCDKCGSDLYQRGDDKPKIVKSRLEVYRRQSEPVITYYKKQGKIPFVNVHMNRPPDEIVGKIIEGLGKLGLN